MANSSNQRILYGRSILEPLDYEAKARAESGNETVKTVQQTRHGRSAKESLGAESVAPTEISQDIVTARDLCGKGGSVFTKHNPRITWSKDKFPIQYHIDNGSAPVTDKETVDYAIRRAFDTYNIALGFIMFDRTVDPVLADVHVRWQYLDGILKNLGRCYYSFYSNTGEIKNASVNFDVADRWFIADTERCGYWGQYFDVQSLACHQIGHVVGLAHNDTDPFATMWPYIKAGDTLKRTLGQADLTALQDLYGNHQ